MEIRTHFRRINKELLPVKLHYFLFMGALACALPFRTVFVKQLGISATAVGVIFFAVPFMRIISNPLCGVFLDYFKRFRLTISVIMIIVALSHAAMVFIPPLPETINNSNITHKLLFDSKLEYSCADGTPSDKTENSIVILNDYREFYKTEANGLTCIMKCSQSASESLPHKGATQQCKESLNFEYSVSIYIADCEMDVHLESGNILITYHNASNSLFSSINATVITYKKFNGLFDQNCTSNAEMLTAQSDCREDLRSRKNISVDSKREIDDFESYTPSVECKNSGSENRKILTMYKYQIQYKNKNWIKNCPCKSEILCTATRCFPSIHKDKTQGEVEIKPIEKVKSEYLSDQFWALFVLITVSSQGLSAVMFMMDTVCYELLQEKKGKYGQQRLWGTVGWGVGALAGGYLNQIFSPDSNEIDYAPSFFLLAIITFIDVIPVCQLKVTNVKYSSHIWKDVCFLLTKVNILCNIVVVYFIGVLSGFIWNYQFWFMEEIGASQLLLGLSQTVECIFELPWFVVSGWIISKIGHRNCNSVTLLCFGLRYLCFAFMYDPWMTLPVAFLHGPTFGLFYASMTMYAKDEAPPGTEATVQSLLHLCFEGVGVATGIILGGVGVDNFGTRVSFLYATAFSFLLLFINVIMNLVFSRFQNDVIRVNESVK